MNIVLLCHERELAKKSNTGQLLLEHEGVSCRQVIWARKAPDAILLSDIGVRQCWLIYPLLEASGEQVNCVPESEHSSGDCRMPPSITEESTFILIDATWQQAQKMYNQSPYLHPLPRLELAREKPSEFRLRKNQKSSGLCTVECAIELLRLLGQAKSAGSLHNKFLTFMAQPRNVLTDERHSQYDKLP